MPALLLYSSVQSPSNLAFTHVLLCSWAGHILYNLWILRFWVTVSMHDTGVVGPLDRTTCGVRRDTSTAHTHMPCHPAREE